MLAQRPPEATQGDKLHQPPMMMMRTAKQALIFILLSTYVLYLLSFHLFSFGNDLCRHQNQEAGTHDLVATDLTSNANRRDVRLAVVTAFSKNHELEEVAMLRSLVANGFEGDVYAYLMRQVGDDPKWGDGFKEELSKSPLSLTMTDFEISEGYSKYCFKPKAVANFLHRNSILSPDKAAQVMMWTDASSRLMQNPTTWAQNMVRDNVDFVGRESGSKWNVPAQTHKDTFSYLGLSPVDFSNYTSFAGTHFLVNLKTEATHQIMTRWTECGSLACQTCMAPLGSSKKEQGASTSTPEGSIQYISHRQDQAVLALLVYNRSRTSSKLFNAQFGKGPLGKGTPYLCVDTQRMRGNVKTLSDWNQTQRVPKLPDPSVCESDEFTETKA